jgi:hypothetical protein
LALDAYVGPLTRFYTGKWTSITTQFLEGFDPDCLILDGGIERFDDFQIKTPEGQVQRADIKSNRKCLSPSATAGQKVEEWRQSLSQSLATRLHKPLDWPEDSSGVYSTDRPGWDAYGALMLWAAHEEHPELERPDTLPEDWFADPAYESSRAENAMTRYPTLLLCTLWLPGDYSFTFRGKAPSEKDVTIGFSTTLIKELFELNARTWGADDISSWFSYAKKREDGLESCAKFAFAVLYALAKVAEEDHQPMVLDW